MKIRAVALLCMTVGAPAFAQVATGVQAVVTAPVGGSSILRAGTSVPLKLAEALTTEGKKLRVGQRFQLEVASDVTVNGVTVVPAGSPATGEITEVRNKGMWGKSGRINARVLYMRVNGRQIRLSGSLDDKGVTGTAGVVGAVVLIPIAGFFVTGTSAKFPLATPVTAFLDEDVPFETVAAAAVAPLQISVPAQTPTAPAAPGASVISPTLTPVSARVAPKTN